MIVSLNTHRSAATSSPRSREGVLEPGAPIGLIELTGDYEQFEIAILSVQLGSAGSDRLDISGAADLAGTLQIGQLPGFVATEGDSFPILACSSRTSEFQTVIFDDPYLDDLLDVVYTPTSVVLVARASTGVDLPPAGGPDGGDGPGASSLPAEFALRIAGANPLTASSGATLEYDVPRSGAPVAISVFDASGRRIADLVDGMQSAGTHTANWSGGVLGTLLSGRMDAGSYRDTKRLVFVK